MKRTWGRVLVLMTGGLFASAVAPACANNDQTIFIRHVMAPPADRQGSRCSYTADPAGASLSGGVLDVAVGDSYFANILYGNQLASRGDRSTNRAESNRVTMNGAVVRVTNTDGSLINEFTSVATGFADPSTGDTPSYGVLGVSILDTKTRNLIAPGLPRRNDSKVVLANVKAFGKSLGGVDVESNEFSFPIQVCNGCLVSFERGNDVNQPPVPNCKLALPEGTQLPCVVGQDEAYPCQLCAGNPVCDPAAP